MPKIDSYQVKDLELNSNQGQCSWAVHTGYSERAAAETLRQEEGTSMQKLLCAEISLLPGPFPDKALGGWRQVIINLFPSTWMGIWDIEVGLWPQQAERQASQVEWPGNNGENLGHPEVPICCPVQLIKPECNHSTSSNRSYPVSNKTLDIALTSNTFEALSAPHHGTTGLRHDHNMNAGILSEVKDLLFRKIQC